MLRVASPEWAEVVASWSDGTAPPVPVGHRGALDGRGILGQMLRTARPVRIEDFDEVGLVDRIDAVGGRLEVSSEPGTGTRLCARLPTTVLGSLNGQ